MTNLNKYKAAGLTEPEIFYKMWFDAILAASKKKGLSRKQFCEFIALAHKAVNTGKPWHDEVP